MKTGAFSVVTVFLPLGAVAFGQDGNPPKRRRIKLGQKPAAVQPGTVPGVPAADQGRLQPEQCPDMPVSRGPVDPEQAARLAEAATLAKQGGAEKLTASFSVPSTGFGI
jgi:hypothetical protein